MLQPRAAGVERQLFEFVFPHWQGCCSAGAEGGDALRIPCFQLRRDATALGVSAMWEFSVVSKYLGNPLTRAATRSCLLPQQRLMVCQHSVHLLFKHCGINMGKQGPVLLVSPMAAGTHHGIPAALFQFAACKSRK